MRPSPIFLPRLAAIAGLILLGAVSHLRADEPAALMGQPVADFAARRQAVMEQVAEAESNRGRPPMVVVRGSQTGDKEDFEEGRFRQNNWFAYLTGFEMPGAYLVLHPAEGKDVLYVPPGRIGSAFSGGIREYPEPGEESASRFGVAEVASTARLLADLFGALEDPMRRGTRGSTPVLYTFRPNPRPEDTSAESKFVRFLKEGAPTTEFKDLAPIVSELRKVKTEAEVALLQETIDITGEAQRAVAGALRPGAHEYELEGALIGAFLKGGAMRPGFASIVGSGPNACIPHYFENNRKMEDGDLVVVDIGAEVQNYTADITRTFPVSGRFTDRQRELYQLVLDCQEHCAEKFVPGETRLFDMQRWAQEFFRNSPLRAEDAQGREQTMDRFFIHGLGHYLGMDVHDVGAGSKPMQPGEVFTIEPGLYILGENIGIRIEDDYLVTEDGLVKMSKDIPFTPDEIEKLIAEAREKAGTGAEAVGVGGGD